MFKAMHLRSYQDSNQGSTLWIHALGVHYDSDKNFKETSIRRTNQTFHLGSTYNSEQPKYYCMFCMLMHKILSPGIIT